MLRLIGFIVVALWVLGLLVRIGGGFIHLLLIIGLIMLIVDFMSSRKTLR